MIQSLKSEPAVSPVIGTILLVAIAVILVAIILTVVMGFSGDTGEKKVGMNAKAESGNNATLILYGGASIPELVKLEMIDQDSPYGEYVKFWDINENETAFVGLLYLAENVARPEKTMEVYDTRINVRGTFTDGTEIILLVQPMTFGNVKGYFGDADDYLTVKWGSAEITDKGPYPVDLKSLPGRVFPSGVYMPGEKISLTFGANLPKEITKYSYRVESVTPQMSGTNRLDSALYLIPATRPSTQTFSPGSVFNGIKGSLDGQWQITIFLCDDNGNVITSKSWVLTTTPKPTEVHTPVPGGTGTTYIKTSSAIILFTYYSEEEPLLAKFYYKNLDTDTSMPPIDANVYGRGTASGSYTATLTGLEGGARYEIYGEITLSTGSVTCVSPFIYIHNPEP